MTGIFTLIAVLYSVVPIKTKENERHIFSFLSFLFIFFLDLDPLKLSNPPTQPSPIGTPPHPARKKKKKQKKFKGFSLSWVLPLYGACSKYHTVTNHPCYNILSSEGSHSDSTKPLWCHGVDGVAHFDLLRGELWRHLSASSPPPTGPHRPPPASTPSLHLPLVRDFKQ